MTNNASLVKYTITTAARKNFVKENATRYTQLARLLYVEQIVIDPMHNLFLGKSCLQLHHRCFTLLMWHFTVLVKTHFYNICVQNKILRPNHKLAKFHEMIADASATFDYIKLTFLLTTSKVHHP